MTFRYFYSADFTVRNYNFSSPLGLCNGLVIEVDAGIPSEYRKTTRIQCSTAIDIGINQVIGKSASSATMQEQKNRINVPTQKQKHLGNKGMKRCVSVFISVFLSEIH